MKGSDGNEANNTSRPFNTNKKTSDTANRNNGRLRAISKNSI